jgi:hypothetical protein
MPTDARQALALVLLAAALGLLWLAFSRNDRAPGPPPVAAVTPYQLRDWSEPRQARLNISLFTYRDRNRNGRYDLGDLPMGSVAVKLGRPGVPDLEHFSNINGFANFQMGYQRDDADISLADVDYRFEVDIPPAWTVTSGNASQVVRFRHLEGSVTGLAAGSPPAPVGLAPVLTISGRVSAVAGDGSESVAQDTRLSAVDPRGREFAPALDGNGAFTLDAVPGSWVLVAEYVPTGEVLRRELVVSDGPVRIATLQFGQQHPEPLAARFTQDFDYLTRSPISKIPGGMGGLDWDYLVAVDNQTYNGPGFVNVLRSGKNVGYNSSGHPVTITPAPDGRHFDFVGGWFGVAWPDAEGETLSVEAWRGGQSIAREELVLSYLGPVWFDADFRQIDRLTLSTAHYWQFIAEDMVFRTE